MESQPYKPFYQPLLFALVLIVGMFLGFKIASSYYFNQPGLLASKSDQTHLDYLINLLNEKYVDSIDKNTLYENGIDGILTSLDPHTVYIPPQETDRVNEELEGNIYGIGIEFFIYQDSVRVLSVMQNSPASKSSISAGDIILQIDDSLIAGKKLEDEQVIKLIKGKKKSTVMLGIRKPDGKQVNLQLQRENIAYSSIIASYVMPQHKDIGYIAIRMFSENTYEEFKEALQLLIDRGITKLIIDVRDNPGGYMDAVTSILDELIPGEHTLLTTKSKDNEEKVLSKNKGIFEKGAVGILINENSASASEILAGAVQDLDRGLVIGRRSYGKGLVQEQFSLPNHAAIRITVARYYLPSGRCIQKDYSQGKRQYQHEIYSRYVQGSLTSIDTSQQTGKKVYYTSAKKEVFGNEGVKPDIQVLLDTTQHALLDSLYNYNLPELFAAQYYYFHKNEFQVFKNENQYENEFQMNQIMSQLFFDFLKKHIPSLQLNAYANYKSKLLSALKAAFANLYFNSNAKYMMMSHDDLMLQKAVEKLQ